MLSYFILRQEALLQIIFRSPRFLNCHQPQNSAILSSGGFPRTLLSVSPSFENNDLQHPKLFSTELRGGEGRALLMYRCILTFSKVFH